MKIGYDAKRFYLNKTGLGNYSRWLVKSLSLFYPDNDYLLYTPKLGSGAFKSENVQTRLPKIRAFTSWWRSHGIVKDLKSDGIELYHGLSHELPAGIKQIGVKSVVTVHDLIVMRYPQYFSAINRFIYINKLKYACKTADKIIAISNQTRTDLVDLLNVSADKIDVIYQSCDASFKSTCTEGQKSAVTQRYKLPGDFILSVGTIEERKNLLLLINALPSVPEINLVVIGRDTAYSDKVKAAVSDLKLTERVHFLTDVGFADLPAIYQLAKVFVYPSCYEGFGIPILEALCSGTPVIAATGSCLEEAGGPESIYINPDDEQELAQQLNCVLNDATLRNKMIDAGKKYSRNFDDEKLAAQMMSVYTSLISSNI